MRYLGMPAGMWALFERSFRDRLTDVLGYGRTAAAGISKKAHGKYRELIGKLPDFEKGDRFQMNIVSCAMLAAHVLSMPSRPGVDELSPKDMEGMKRTAAFRAADRNPYSWNMEYLPYADGSGYEARFSKCGICTLMGELGLGDLVPAMCRLDYTMSEAGGTTDFVREYTLASGGPYCDCGYKKKGKAEK